MADHSQQIVDELFEMQRQAQLDGNRIFELESINADLLAACENLWRRYEAATDGVLGCGLVNNDFFMLRDAIAKARGER